MSQPIGFCVVYRWRLRDGHEASFRKAWAVVTEAIAHKRGGLGSRLHRTDDGEWLAYAQWPDRETWERSQAAAPVAEEAFATMRTAIAHAADPVPLEPVEDLLS